MSNSELFLGKLDIRKVATLAPKAFKGKSGDYVDIAIWVNEEPDQYGNHVSISFGAKGEEKVYLASAKKFSKAETAPF